MHFQEGGLIDKWYLDEMEKVAALKDSQELETPAPYTLE